MSGLTTAEKLFRHNKTSMGHTSGTSPVCLVDLVCFVYLVDLVHLVSFVQPNKRDKPKKPFNGLLMLADYLSILLERPFSLKIPAKAAHQFGTECPTFRFLHVRVRKMPTNFL
jgi:hypothetical protein